MKEPSLKLMEHIQGVENDDQEICPAAGSHNQRGKDAKKDFLFFLIQRLSIFNSAPAPWAQDT